MFVKYLIEDLDECSRASRETSNGFHALIQNAQNFNSLLALDNQIRCVQTYVEKCKSRLIDENFLNNPVEIPHITHKVWLTSSSQPKLPLEKVLISARDFYNSFPSYYVHKVWVNNDWVAEQLNVYFAEFNISFINIDKCEFILEHQINLLINDGKFAFACDLLRVELLANEGGVYSDWGIKFLVDVIPAVERNRFTFIFGDGGFFQNSLMSCSTECAFFKKLVTLLSSPNELALNVLSDIDAASEGWLGAGPLITVFFYLSVSSHTKVLLLRGNDKCLKWAAQKSWYTEEGSKLIGSSVVSDTAPTYLDIANHEEPKIPSLTF